ncbi:MAG: hypothetical protein Q9225_005343 [Loekoesia sp. 1 TL-2023]
MRHLSAPFIFRGIKIGQRWDWNRALRALNSIALCEAVCEYAKSFIIDLYIGEDRAHRGPKPPSRFPLKLLEVLTGLANLEKLTLIIPEHHTEAFRKTFEEANASFPGIRTLVLGPYMDWMIAMCPKVETISSSDWRWLRSNVDGEYQRQYSTNLINSAGRATSLRHFEMNESWTVRRLETVHQAMPRIQSLAMRGCQYRDGIETLLPTLSRFQNLTSLVLADAHGLKVGFNPPFCGNTCMGPDGQKYYQQIYEEGRQAEERVANMVFPKLPKLGKLWIEDFSEARVTRTEFGVVNEINWVYHYG